MKKKYMHPQIDGEFTILQQSLLVDSMDVNNNDGDDEVDDFDDLLGKSRWDETTEDMTLW